MRFNTPIGDRLVDAGELDAAARRVGAHEFGPHGVAGADPVGPQTGQHRRLGELHERAALVLVDDDAVEHLAFATRQEYGLGEVEHRLVDLVAELVGTRHHGGELVVRLLDVLGDGVAVGHGEGRRR